MNDRFGRKKVTDLMLEF